MATYIEAAYFIVNQALVGTLLVIYYVEDVTSLISDNDLKLLVDEDTDSCKELLLEMLDFMPDPVVIHFLCGVYNMFYILLIRFQIMIWLKRLTKYIIKKHMEALFYVSMVSPKLLSCPS